MKILHTADWHIGTFKGPEKDGVNLRSADTMRCLRSMVEAAKEEHPDLTLVSGDIFHLGRTWSDRCCEEVIQARRIIYDLSRASGQVIVMRGTPNHDGEGPFKVLKEYFPVFSNVHIVTEPEIIQTPYADVAVLPGFDVGTYRAQFPGMGKEEENEAISQELGNIVLGMKAQCSPDKISILMAHYTVPGCNTESGQSQILTQFEPIIPTESLEAANFGLVALGHIHRPQRIGVNPWYYSGAVNAMNFNDEGQERGFWVHTSLPFGGWNSQFYKTPYREFVTFHFTDADIEAIILGHMDEVAENWWRRNGEVQGRIVRVLYECTAEKKKAFNTSTLEKALYEDGAFWVAGITPERIEEAADRTDMSDKTDPEENLRRYLEGKGMDKDDIGRLILKARPIMGQAMASDVPGAFSGLFVPIEIEVKNYRAYAEERFSFEDIQFCTINGQNGAGKSSLFMDAIIDCLFEEPREGRSTSVKVPWLRNDENVRSGYISFTFSIGDSVYRVVRTRARSGKGTLNLSEYTDGEWVDRSQEKFNDTQADIERIIGVDSLTFRSCALIMQDQYGLFLQARKEDRMVILGNLLGLGIYGAMEDIAGDLAVDKRRLIAGKKNSISIQNANILSAGKPAEEMEKAETELSETETKLKEKNLELQNCMVFLATKQEAKERRRKLLEGIYTLGEKKRATGKNRDDQRGIIASCDAILDRRPEIEAGVSEYKSMMERERQLAGESAMYSSKKREAEDLRRQAGLEREAIGTYEKRIRQKENELSRAQPGPQDAEIRQKAGEFEQRKADLDAMRLKENAFRKAELEYKAAVYARNEVSARFNTEKGLMEARKYELEKKVAILSEARCVDIENAHCRFLQDALEAKERLKAMDGEIADIEARKQAEISAASAAVSEAEKAMASAGFDEAGMAALQKMCHSLLPYVEKCREIDQKAGKAALLEADIGHLRASIQESEKRLEAAEARLSAAGQERDRYAGSFEEHSRVLSRITSLEPWLEMEKQLAVAEERKKTALVRAGELEAELLGIDKEMADKTEQADAELQAAEGAEELERKKAELASESSMLTEQARDLHIRIGGLRQKIDEIRRMEADIRSLQEEVNALSADAADYEQLKLAFSQDGIPHQIIRSIIPRLSATANSILGQMTGGQLGVDFRTEMVLKSNSKKEVVTLDIFIEEYGKSSLPYLSKSGGEKVKASLSVILALAEIKSSTAGIQFGMLFIDEPPFLDSDGIQAYCDALETIGVRYPGIKIMAITHDPTMKARFPQNLDVVKTENGSKVVFR